MTFTPILLHLRNILGEGACVKFFSIMHGIKLIFI